MGIRICALVTGSCLLAAAAGVPQAACAAGGKEQRIYTCIDAQGRRLSSDRPIPECLAREQQLLNRDGSRRAVVPPALTPEEQARHDQLMQQQEQQRAEREEARRRDRALLLRYPDRTTYEAARQRALAPVQQLIDVALNRLTHLEAEGAKLRASASTVTPEALRQRKLMNEGAIEAQRNMLRSHLDEQARLTQQMDVERERLELLWANLAAAAAGGAAASATPSSATGAQRGR